MDFLKSAVASAISKGPPFPYTFGDRLDLEQSFWTLHNGIKREDGSNCSIFSFDVTANKSRLPLAKNAVRKLKTLRHPGIVKVLDTVETETYIYVATERVTPLSWHVRRKSLSPETTKWGLYTVANTLKFINGEGASVHGGIRVSSIFTSESGEWKLGGLDILSSMKDDDAVIFTYAGLLPDINRYAPPEVSRTGWDSIKRNPVAAPDSYDYGLLIYEVFNQGDLGMDSPGQTKNIPPSMHQPYKRLLNANPKARLTVAHFLEQGRRSGGFFETPLIRLSDGVDSLGLKTDEEKEELLGELDEVSDDFPEEFFKMKILPELLKSVEFGGGGPRMFNYVMKIAKKLPSDDFEARLNPVILRLFASPDRQMRVSLLDNLPLMIDHFSQKLVTDKVWPQVTTGFSDTAPVVREQTVKAVLTLIAKLSDRVINGELLKCLAKTANDEQPGIRTNTTICLGKIARNLGVSTRSKVLIAAFSRSLRDPFVHGRSAALQALAATSDIFSEDDCANKLLPGLCPSLLDKEKIVRDQANKTLDLYLTRVRKHASTLPDTALPPATAATASTNGTAPRIGTPSTDAASWTGWAISSFTNKLTAASGEIQPPASKPNGVPSITRTSSSPAVPSLEQPPRPSSSSASTLARQALTSSNATTIVPSIQRTSSTSSIPDILTPADADDDGTAFDDAWGDLPDDEGDSSFFDTLGETANASNSPASATAKPAASPTPFDDGGEPDFAGWLSAQKAGKSKNPLPKGLNKTSVESPVSATTPKTGVNRKGIPARPPEVRKAVTSPPAATTPISTKPKDEEDDEGDWGAWD